MTEEKPFFYRKISVVAIIFLVFLIALIMRQIFYQSKHHQEAKFSIGIERVKAYERVILNHFPLSPYSKKAVDGLLKECNAFKENDEKLYCYETLRSSLIQIRSFYQPYIEAIEKIKPKIADLRAKEKIAWKYNKITMNDYEKIYSEQMAILNHDNSPSLFWSLVTVLSLLGWMGSIVFIILRGFIKPMNKKSLTVGILAYLIFFSLWVFGLWNA